MDKKKMKNIIDNLNSITQKLSIHDQLILEDTIRELTLLTKENEQLQRQIDNNNIETQSIALDYTEYC